MLLYFSTGRKLCPAGPAPVRHSTSVLTLNHIMMTRLIYAFLVRKYSKCMPQILLSWNRSFVRLEGIELLSLSLKMMLWSILGSNSLFKCSNIFNRLEVFSCCCCNNNYVIVAAYFNITVDSKLLSRPSPLRCAVRFFVCTPFMDTSAEPRFSSCTEFSSSKGFRPSSKTDASTWVGGQWIQITAVYW